MYEICNNLDIIRHVSVIIIPFIPIIPYLLIFLLSFRYQLKPIEDRKDPILNMRMGSNLTLAGFNFTVIALLLNLYQKNELVINFYPIYYFSLSLIFFMLSYILLHLRLRKAFDFASDVFTVSGLWTIIAGLYFMFHAYEPLKSISLAFQILLIIFLIYIIIDCRFKYLLIRGPRNG